jgi:hypothetical protein
LADDIQDADFSPLDDQLAVIRQTNDGFAIEYPLGTTIKTATQWLSHLRFSPTGDQLAFLVHPSASDDAGELHVLTIANQHVEILTADWSSIAGLAWDPQGHQVWFTGAKHDDELASLHRVSRKGDVQPIARSTGRLRLHDIAAHRIAAVSLDVWRQRTLVGTRGQPGEVDHSRTNIARVVDIGSDGTTLLMAEATGAFVVNLAQQDRLRISDGVPLALSPSGAYIAIWAERAGAPALLAMATRSAQQRPFRTRNDIDSARWLDEDALLACSSGGAAQVRMWRLTSTDEPRAVTEPGIAGHPALDERRERCAFVSPAGQLYVLTLATNQVVACDGEYRNYQACGWLSASDEVVLRPAATPIELIAVQAKTGARRPLQTITPPVIGLKAVDEVVISHDGHNYAYTVGQEWSQLFEVDLPTR